MPSPLPPAPLPLPLPPARPPLPPRPFFSRLLRLFLATCVHAPPPASLAGVPLLPDPRCSSVSTRISSLFVVLLYFASVAFADRSNLDALWFGDGALELTCRPRFWVSSVAVPMSVEGSFVSISISFLSFSFSLISLKRVELFDCFWLVFVCVVLPWDVVFRCLFVGAMVRGAERRP